MKLTMMTQEDNLEVRHESTDTEQEMSDVASENELDTDDLDNYIGKDGETVSKKSKPRVNIITRAHNIIMEQTGVKGSAKNAKTPKDCWSRFFDESVINILVECTNKYINENKASCSRDRDAKHTSKEEVSDLMGLLYLAWGVQEWKTKFERSMGARWYWSGFISYHYVNTTIQISSPVPDLTTKPQY